jgi:hypothetical protein
MAPPLPWRATTAVDPDVSYVVAITRLPLRRHTRIPAVMRATWQIVRELVRSDGLVGYSLKADLIRKTFWTISAWDSTDSLHAFVRSEVHVRAMTASGPHMNEPRIETTVIPGTDLPAEWSQVRDRLTKPRPAPI